jgi:hypothetical protein
MTQEKSRERWVPRCPTCHNGHIIVAPSPCEPNVSGPHNVYCIECGHTISIGELLYVRL